MLNGIRNRLAGVLATQPASPAGLRPPTGLGRPLVVNEKIALDARKFLRGLTPQRISSVFDSADRYIGEQIQLAAELEELNDHLAGTLELRRTAVLRLNCTVAAGDPQDETSAAAAKAAGKIIAAPWFEGLCGWLLRATWHQHTAAEILYRQGGVTSAELRVRSSGSVRNRHSALSTQNSALGGQPEWTPFKFRAVEPARWHFTEDKEARIMLSLMQGVSDENLIELNPGRFARLDYNAVYGQPGSYATVRDSAKLAFLRNFALLDWGMRVDKHGQPFMHVQYQPGMSDEEIRRVIGTLMGYAANLIAATPAGTTVELTEIDPDSPHQHLIDFCDRALSKRLLGQDTSQSALEGQRTGSQIQANVRDDIRDGDARLLDAALNETLLAPWCAWNYGPEVAPPTVQHVAKTVRDPEAMGRVVTIGRGLGLPIGKAWTYDVLGIQAPDEDAELLGTGSDPAAADGSVPVPNGGDGVRGTGTAGVPALPVPLTAQQITSALDILSKYREATLEAEPATMLLEGLGLGERAAAMVKATPQGRKDTDADIAFKRDMVRAFLADGTTADVLYNATKIEELLTAVNVPLEPGYQAPWLPIVVAPGAVATGEPTKDSQGDVVGGGVESVAALQPPAPPAVQSAERPAQADPQVATQHSALGTQHSALRAQAVLAARRSEFNRIVASVRRLAARSDSLEQFQHALPQLLGASGDELVDVLDSATLGAYCDGRLAMDRALAVKRRGGPDVALQMRTAGQLLSVFDSGSESERAAIARDIERLRKEAEKRRAELEQAQQKRDAAEQQQKQLDELDRKIAERQAQLAESQQRLDQLREKLSPAGRSAPPAVPPPAAPPAGAADYGPPLKIEELDPVVDRARFAEAIDAFAQRTDLMAKEEFLKLQGANRARAWTVARLSDLGVMKDLHGAVGQAIEGGQSWREFKDSLDSLMEQRGWAGLEPWHAHLVYSQNVMMAQSAGRTTQAHDAGAGYWRKLPTVSAVPRVEHQRFDNQVFSFAQKTPPPWDFGCKCEWEPVFDDELGDAERASLGVPADQPPGADEFQWDASHYFRPIEVRVGDYPEGLWPVVKSLASDANALLSLRE